MRKRFVTGFTLHNNDSEIAKKEKTVLKGVADFYGVFVADAIKKIPIGQVLN
jgi:hypothetical protein